MASSIQGVAARGVRKINEQTVQEGRALIITEENENLYSWEDIPNGSLKVNGSTGLIMVKLAGQSNWIPSNVRLDIARDSEGNILDINGNKITDPVYLNLVETAMSQGGHTLSIAKDAIIIRENFTIKEVSTDEFTYEDENGNRYFGNRTRQGFWFELKKGHYAPGRNMLDVVIDDCLYRSAASGGIVEVSETKFIMPEDLVVDMEITIKYYQLNRIGNPYPRIYLRRGNYSVSADGYEELTGSDDIYFPENAEVGDLWLDYNGSPDDDDGYLADEISGGTGTIPWHRISGVPTTVAEAAARGFVTDAAVKNHRHKIADIEGLEKMVYDAVSAVPIATKAETANSANTAKKADNAQLLQNRTIGNSANNIVVVQSNNKINDNLISDKIKTISNMLDYDDFIRSMHSAIQSYFSKGMIMAWWGEAVNVPEGWVICNGENNTPNLSDKFIMGVGKHVLGEDVQAGLPTIRGKFGANAKAYDEEYSGAFTRTSYSFNGANTDDTGAVIDFNATRSNPIFGASDTVQPPAMAMYYIMKT